VYGEGRGRALLASLVPAVEKAAQDGDAVAREILADAGRALAVLTSGIAARLGLEGGAFDLFLVGGVFKVGRLVVGPLQEALRRRAPGAHIRRPRFPPAVGAVLLAFEAAGLRADRGVLGRFPPSLS
jgi:N-acetylglucosamine kinase-like BadF-type ATPase